MGFIINIIYNHKPLLLLGLNNFRSGENLKWVLFFKIFWFSLLIGWNQIFIWAILTPESRIFKEIKLMKFYVLTFPPKSAEKSERLWLNLWLIFPFFHMFCINLRLEGEQKSFLSPSPSCMICKHFKKFSNSRNSKF